MTIPKKLIIEEIQRRKYEREWERCKNDSYYWLTTYVYTLDPHDEKNPIKLFPKKEYIRELIKIWKVEKLLLIEKSRQMLMTWLECALNLHEAQFNEGKFIFFQSKKEDDANELVSRAKHIYHHQKRLYICCTHH